MTFLNPILLFGLPLIALPVLIHLINQRRHQSVEWGAMRFLLSAKRVSRGVARLRHVGILTARMLIVAGLIFALGRPLATGWFGTLAGGKPETVIVLLDRSASMQSQDLTSGESKRTCGLNKIVDLIAAYGNDSKVVLIDSANNTATEIENSRLLADLPNSQPTDGSADIPSMLQTALDFVADNQTGRTDIWICSDAQRSDWDAESGRWETLQGSFSDFAGVRFHILNFNEAPQRNYSVQVESVERVIENESQSALVLDILINRSKDVSGATELPVEITINGARTVVNAKAISQETRIAGYRIPIGNSTESGWGKIELPADSNSSDNQYFFSFAKTPEVQTTIVTENTADVDALKLICSVTPSTASKATVKVLAPDQLNEIDWANSAMLLWHGPLPDSATANRIEKFVASGRIVFFFPPEQSGSNEFAGFKWGNWKTTSRDAQTIGFWKNESDILGSSREGKPLPVENLNVFRYRQLDGADRPLAKLKNGDLLVTRKTTDAGGVYFCATLPSPAYSNLAQNGVVAFAMMHRAIDVAAPLLGNAKQVVACSPSSSEAATMKQVAGSRAALAEQNPYVAGVYSSGDKMVAINRPANENDTNTLANSEVESLFEGLNVYLIEQRLGNIKSLASETWKVFVVIACLALLLEAILCMPQKQAEIAS